MAKGKKRPDPIPDEFASYKEAGDFWDEHDTADYPEAFTDVEMDIKIEGRRWTIDIDDDVMSLLRERSRKGHVGPGRLASRLLRKELTAS